MTTPMNRLSEPQKRLLTRLWNSHATLQPIYGPEWVVARKLRQMGLVVVLPLQQAVSLHPNLIYLRDTLGQTPPLHAPEELSLVIEGRP